MPSSASPPSLAEPVLTAARELADLGRFGEAHARLERVRPLARWAGIEERALASRVAHHRGAARLSHRLDVVGYREARTHAGAQARFLVALLDTSGPVAVLERAARLPQADHGSVEDRAALLVAVAEAHRLLRDFRRAHARLEDALALAPGLPRALGLRVRLLESEDRIDEAVAEAEALAAGEPQPWRWEQLLVWLWPRVGRVAEASKLAEEAAFRYEVGSFAAVGASLALEGDEPERAARLVERAVELAPLAEPPLAKALAELRSEVVYRRDTSRRTLAVPFVRQDWLTCAPAAMASVLSFHGEPVPMRAIAADVCYGGTSSTRQRGWLEARGFVVRELCVTELVAKRLVDAGLPFALTTAQPGSAHLSIVVGYDEGRGTLVLRDPSTPLLQEVPAAALLAQEAARGCQGQVFVPKVMAGRLAALDLPGSAMAEAAARVSTALAEHRRAEAEEAFAVLAALRPEVTGGPTKHAEEARRLRAEAELARYDGDGEREARVWAKLAELFPDDDAAWLTAHGAARRTGTRAERRARLEARAARPGAHPLVLEELAAEVMLDAREHGTARFHLRRVLTTGALRGRALWLLGRLERARGRNEAGRDLLRTAVHVDVHDESLAFGYFAATLEDGHPRDGLALLASRCAELGALSSAPRVTYAAALESTGRRAEAMKVLVEAVSRHPEDGALLVEAADAFLRAGDLARACALAERARGRCREADATLLAARIAGAHGDEATMGALLERITTTWPGRADGWEARLRHVLLTDGATAARALARRASAMLDPESAVVWLRSSREEHAAGLEALLGREGSAWAFRERSLTDERAGRFEDALAAARSAWERAPHDESSALILAHALEQTGARDEAEALLRRWLEHRPESAPALTAWLALLRPAARAPAVLAFGERLRTGPRTSPVLDAWATALVLYVEPEAARAAAHELARAWPDEPLVRAAALAVYADTGALAEARRLLAELPAPLAQEPSVLRARVLIASREGDQDEERGALEALAACELAAPFATRLARLRAREGDLGSARLLLRRALLSGLEDDGVALTLAELDADDGDVEVARRRLAALVDRSPALVEAHGLLARLDGDGALARARAEGAADATPGSLDHELAAGLLLLEDGDDEAALERARRALAAAPSSVAARDLAVRAQVSLGRFDGADRDAGAPALGAVGRRRLAPRRAWARYVGAAHAAEGAEAEAPDPAALRLVQAEARKALEEALVDEPDFGAGWDWLVRFADEAGDLAQERRAAWGLLRASPGNPYALALVADVMLREGERREALALFVRAVRLAPTYPFAVSRAARLLLDEGEARDARALLARSEAAYRDHGGWPLSLEPVRVETLAEAGDPDGARAAFERIVTSPTLPGDVVSSAYRVLVAAGHSVWVEDVLCVALRSGSAHDEAGALLLALRVAQGARPEAVVSGARGEAPIFAALARAHATKLATTGRGMALRLFVVRHGRALRADVAAWADVIAALVQVRAWASAVLASLVVRGRSHPPWVLQNVAMAYRKLGLWRLARRASERALAAPEADGTTGAHAVFLAFVAACRGRTAESRAYLTRAEGASLSEFHGTVRRLVTAMLLVQEAPVGAPRRQAAALARERLAEFSPPATYETLPADLRSFYGPAARRIAWDGRRVRDLLFFYRQPVLVALATVFLTFVFGSVAVGFVLVLRDGLGAGASAARPAPSSQTSSTGMLEACMRAIPILTVVLLALRRKK